MYLSMFTIFRRSCFPFLSSFPHSLKQLGKIEPGSGELPSLDCETGRLEGFLHVLCLVEVRAGGLGGSREQLTHLLQNSVIPGVGSEGDDQALLRELSQTLNHLKHLIRGVMNHHIDARHVVVRSLQILEIRRHELHFVALLPRQNFRCPSGGLLSHGLADIGSIHSRTHGGQGEGQGADTTTGIAEGLSLQRLTGGRIVRLHPCKNFVHSLMVPLPDVLLDGVHIIRLRVNFVPPFKTNSVEIIRHLLLLCIFIGCSRRLPLCDAGGTEGGRGGFAETVRTSGDCTMVSGLEGRAQGHRRKEKSQHLKRPHGGGWREKSQKKTDI
mmetsp:Transcript_17436/g.35416  ORF Transcript_17436/g.35416 Transcript_17436/m.35416 type:complete len:326 (+) Transcript_17436:287-1264(+)